MDPDLLNMILVVSPVIVLGFVVLWLSSIRRAKVREAFRSDGWTVFTRDTGLESHVCLEKVNAALSGVSNAAWGSKGLYWFGDRTSPRGSAAWIIAQYQHVSMPRAQHSKPVPMSIAGLLMPSVSCSMEICRRAKRGFLTRDLSTIFQSPTSTGDPAFGARWTVTCGDPLQSTKILQPSVKEWLESLPPDFRCVLVHGAVLIIADRWFVQSDVAPVRTCLDAFPTSAI